MSDREQQQVYRLNWLGKLWYYTPAAFWVFILCVLTIAAWSVLQVVSYLG